MRGTQPLARAADNAGMNRTPFSPAFAKLTIGSLDDHEVEVEAQYNPHELAVDKQIAWHDKPRGEDVEHAEAPKRTMAIELLFDGFERGESVAGEIAVLEKLSDIRTNVPPLEHHRRPHHCVVTWGAAGTRPLRCVIETLTTRVTMFAPDGAPLRATCTVKLKEVNVLAKLR